MGSGVVHLAPTPNRFDGGETQRTGTLDRLFRGHFENPVPIVRRRFVFILPAPFNIDGCWLIIRHKPLHMLKFLNRGVPMLMTIGS